MLFTVSMTILRQKMGDAANDTGAWLTEDTGLEVSVALGKWRGRPKAKGDTVALPEPSPIEAGTPQLGGAGR